jgi:hypothetical protein
MKVEVSHVCVGRTSGQNMYRTIARNASMWTKYKIEAVKLKRLSHVYIITILLLRKNAARYDRWPTYKCGQIQKVHYNKIIPT